MAHRVLWLHVLKVGLADARRSEADAAWIWSDEFELVCALAGVDPDILEADFYRRQGAVA